MLHDDLLKVLNQPQTSAYKNAMVRLQHRAVPVYFSDVTEEQELVESYDEFVLSQGGKLISAYDYMNIVVKNGAVEVSPTGLKYEGYSMHNSGPSGDMISHLLISWVKIDVVSEGDAGVLSMYARLNTGRWSQIVPYCGVSADVASGQLMVRQLPDRWNVGIHHPKQMEDIWESMQKGQNSSNDHLIEDAGVGITMDIFRQTMMMMNLPHFEKTTNIIPAKVVSNRIAKGGGISDKYIVVRLKPEIREAIENGERTKTGKRPHWRRGHIRNLSGERRTWVSPCMINWDGTPIEPKTYLVNKAS